MTRLALLLGRAARHATNLQDHATEKLEVDTNEDHASALISIQEALYSIHDAAQYLGITLEIGGQS